MAFRKEWDDIWTKAMHTGKAVKPVSSKKTTTPYMLPNGSNAHCGDGLFTGNKPGSATISFVREKGDKISKSVGSDRKSAEHQGADS